MGEIKLLPDTDTDQFWSFWAGNIDAVPDYARLCRKLDLFMKLCQIMPGCQIFFSMPGGSELCQVSHFLASDYAIWQHWTIRHSEQTTKIPEKKLLSPRRPGLCVLRKMATLVMRTFTWKHRARNKVAAASHISCFSQRREKRRGRVHFSVSRQLIWQRSQIFAVQKKCSDISIQRDTPCMSSSCSS